MSDVFAGRRDRVMAALERDSAALIVAAAPELHSGDAEYRYIPAADLFYLTGLTEPETVLVLCPSADPPLTIFVRPRNPEHELWTGSRGGVEAARASFGDKAAHPIGELGERLTGLIAGASVLYTSLESDRPDVDAAVRTALGKLLHARPRTGRGVHTLTDARVLIGPMRVRKDAHEVAAIRHAADITVAAFTDAARSISRATHEYVVEATLDHGFRSRGAMGPAFPTITAAGANATVLHYTTNTASLQPGDLLLADAGARVDMYCADVTRTFPVGGRFTAEQRAVYDVVLAAHDAAVSCIEPGRTTADVEDAAVRVLVQGMLDLGLLVGSIDTLIEKREHKRWFPHRVSHWLGLDVHDVGDYMIADTPVTLADGMVLTVEPGLYIPADAADAPAALRGTGVRLEDDVLVTASGADVLTRGLAIRPGDVEALVRG